MATKHHMAQSVRGLLHYSDRELKSLGALSWLTHDGGQPYRSISELREALMEELAKGHEVLPYGTCESFDPKTGCPGHPTDEPK